MRWDRIATLVVSIGAFASMRPVRADDDADLRRDVDALAGRIEDGPQPDADSPTAIVNRLLAAGEPRLRPVLEEAWRIAVVRSSSDEEREDSVSWIVRFLYGRVERTSGGVVGDAEASPIVGADGVVRLRPGDGSPIHGGIWLAHPPPPPTFAQLVEGGKLRLPSRPWAAAELLDELPQVLAGNDFPDALDDGARAVGEACASDAVLRGRLLAFVDDACVEPSLFTAAAWTKAPEAVKLLCDHLPRLASVALSDYQPTAPFRAACLGLVHADRAALARAVAKLRVARQQDESWRNVGLDVAEPNFVDWLDSAETPAARIAVLRRVAEILHKGSGTPATTSVAPVLARIAVELDRGDAETRAAAIAAAEALLGGGTGPLRTGTSWSSSGADWSRKSDGESIRPYPDGAEAIAVWTADLALGRIAFVPRRPSAFDDETQPPTRLEPEVLSDVAPADLQVDRMPRTPGVRLRLRGESVADGLSLTLTNAGDADVSINPVALRYVSAEVMDETIAASGKQPRSHRRLSLFFGRTPHAAAVGARFVVKLAPGKSFEWTTPIRPKDRDVDHVVISLAYDIRVRGKPPAPLVTHFSAVWVK